jgi:hypothetical protein
MSAQIAAALEDVASTAYARGHVDVYRFAMSACGLILTDPERHKLTAEAVLDSCRFYLAKAGRA